MAINLKAIPKGVKLSTEEVSYLASRAKELLAALQARIAGLRGQVQSRLDALLQEAADIVRDSAQENKATARQYSKHAAHSKFSKFKANVVANSHASRQELLGPLKTLAEKAGFLMEMFASPAQALGRVALGDNRRTQLQLQLTGAGPVELESAAALAVVTEDIVLAASLVTVVDRMPRKDRPFSVPDFATIMWGEQHAEVVAKLKAVLHAYKLAEIADKEFTSGEVNQVSRISALLDQRAIDAEAARAGDAA